MAKQEKYSAKNIVKLDPREHIRRRPGMYVGGNDLRALHHLIYEVLDSSAEDAFIGQCDSVTIRLQAQNVVTIRDNSTVLSDLLRQGQKTLDQIASKFGNKFDNDAYKVSGGLHGVGITAVNALSTEFTIQVIDKGMVQKQIYREGLPYGALQRYRLTETEPNGTCISFQPDFSIFEAGDFDFDRIAQRCLDIAHNTPSLIITLIDERVQPHRQQIFHMPEGLKTLVAHLNRDKKPLHEIIHAAQQVEAKDRHGNAYPIYIEFALQYSDSNEYIEKAYVNTVPNEQGGTHIEALRATIQSGIKEHLEWAFSKNLEWEQISKGLTLAVSVRHPDPQFQSPTKTKLMNPEIYGEVCKLAYPVINRHSYQLSKRFESLYDED